MWERLVYHITSPIYFGLKYHTTSPLPFFCSLISLSLWHLPLMITLLKISHHILASILLLPRFSLWHLLSAFHSPIQIVSTSAVLSKLIVIWCNYVYPQPQGYLRGLHITHQRSPLQLWLLFLKYHITSPLPFFRSLISLSLCGIYCPLSIH